MESVGENSVYTEYVAAFKIVVLVICCPDVFVTKNCNTPGTEVEQPSMKAAIVDSYINEVDEDRVMVVSCLSTYNVVVLFAGK